MERILIFQLNWMGDILFSFPFIRSIRKAYPDAYIACAVVARYADLLLNVSWINKMHMLSDDNSIFAIPEKLTFINQIKKEGYDTCFLLKPSRIKTVMSIFSGIGERIGFGGKNALLTKEVEIPADNLHRADQILSLAAAIGIEKADGTCEYFITTEDENRADILLRQEGSGLPHVIALNPGANWNAKRWPQEKFIQLAEKIIANFNDVEIIITGSENDIGLSESIAREVGNHRCYTVAGKTGLNESAGLFTRCQFVISADSGPLHLASACGTTTIGLFGPTSSKITGPRGRGKNIVISRDIDCEVPCYADKCAKDYRCMDLISVDEVFEVVKKLLN